MDFLEKARDQAFTFFWFFLGSCVSLNAHRMTGLSFSIRVLSREGIRSAMIRVIIQQADRTVKLFCYNDAYQWVW